MSLTRKQIDHVLWLAEQQKQAADAAWNAAIEAAARLFETRGARIRGAVNPDKAAAEIRALKREAK